MPTVRSGMYSEGRRAPQSEGASVSLTSLSLSRRPGHSRWLREGRRERTRRQEPSGGAPRRRRPLWRARPRPESAGLGCGASVGATPLTAQAIPLPAPPARVRARAAAPRGAGGFAWLRALPRRTAMLPPGARGLCLRTAARDTGAIAAAKVWNTRRSLGKSQLPWLPEATCATSRS